MPDNSVMIVDQISIPSFPNVFPGKNRVYYREEAVDATTFRYLELGEDNYKPSAFKDALNNAFTNATKSTQSARVYALPMYVSSTPRPRTRSPPKDAP